MTGLAICLVGAVLAALPWHETLSPDLAGALCWVPDCHPDTSPIRGQCTGYDELGAWHLLLAACAAVQLALLIGSPRRRWLVALLAVVAATALAVVYVVSVAFGHLFDSTRTLPAEWAFRAALFGLLAITALQQLRALRSRGPQRPRPPPLGATGAAGPGLG